MIASLNPGLSWLQTVAATGNWPRTISGGATSSPKPSHSSAPPASVPIPGQRPSGQGKAASGNNPALLTMTIRRHADSSKTRSPTSPPRRRVKKWLKITNDSRQTGYRTR